MTECVIVLVTTSGPDESQKIARALLEQKKAACVNIIPDVQSFFWWDNQIDSARENLLVVKTTTSLLDAVIDTVKQAHSYEVPEIIALPVIGGNPDYLDWVKRTTNNTG